LWFSFTCFLFASNVTLVQAQTAEPHNQSQLQLLQNDYLSPAVESDQRGAYSSLGGRISFKDVEKVWTFGIDSNGIAALDGTNENYIAIPDLYAAYRGLAPGVTVTVGRQRQQWSVFDEEWSLGIWQPMARWDYINPQQQGLTGVFFHYEADNFKLMLFGSGLFIPDQGPNFQLQNGQFVSDNRWFEAPESELLLRERVTKINYELDRPSVGSVINHGGFGFKGTLGDTHDGAWVSFAAAILPLNQLHISIDPTFSTSLTNFSQEALAVVHPSVVNHQITTLEAGFTEDDDRGWISITRDVPNHPDVPDSWEQSSLNTVLFGGICYARRVELLGMKRSEVKVAFLQRWDESSALNSGIAGDQVQSSYQRFDFAQVASIAWEAEPLQLATRTIRFGVRYLYSLPDQGGWLSTNAKMIFDKDLIFSLGFDILGADTDSTTSLMGRYRNNDRVLGGVSYVF
jgi:hypothetical protein